MPHTIQTNVTVIGRGGDGSLLHAWDEGERSFVERYTYTRVASGYRLGCVQVIETTEPGICPACSGSGEGQFEGATCRFCDGRGEL